MNFCSYLGCDVNSFPRDYGTKPRNDVEAQPSAPPDAHYNFGDKLRAGAPCASKTDPPLSLKDTRVLAV